MRYRHVCLMQAGCTLKAPPPTTHILQEWCCPKQCGVRKAHDLSQLQAPVVALLCVACVLESGVALVANGILRPDSD